MKIELKIGEKVYGVSSIVDEPYVKVLKEMSVSGFERTLFASSDNRYFLNMSKSMMVNTKCDVASIRQYDTNNNLVREITMEGCEIKSTSNNSIEIECRNWEDRYVDVEPTKI